MEVCYVVYGIATESYDQEGQSLFYITDFPSKGEALKEIARLLKKPLGYTHYTVIEQFSRYRPIVYTD